MSLLIDLSIKEFSRVLASDAPAPGGGSVAALQGALGASLSHMVASLTVGRAKYAEYAALVEELQKKSAALQEKFLAVIDEDTQAFNKVTAALALPKETDSEKAARKEALQLAFEACTVPPYKTMELSLEALELTAQAVGKTNTSASSDLGVAALSLKAALLAAWLNVLTNIGGLANTTLAESYRTKGEAIIKKAVPLADDIYTAILKGM
jgi:formiminotetrahydrofolate cyclodeaminase